MRLSAELELPAAVVQRGERLAYHVVNTGDEPIVFDEGYRLERQTRAGWIECPTGPFRLVGYVLQRGGRRELSLRISLGQPPGRHRLLKEVRYDMEGASRARLAPPRAPAPLRLEAEFDVFAA